MAESMRLYVPVTEYAKSNTDTLYFPDKCELGLNFDPLNWEAGIPDGSNLCIIKIDADARATAGSIEYGLDWACIYLRNWQQLFSSGKQVVFKSTTSASYTGLVTRGTRTILSAGTALIMVTFNSTQDRYWQIELQNLSGIAPQIELVMMGTTADIQSRWNHGGPVRRDDRTISEITLGRAYSGRKVAGHYPNNPQKLNIETRVWEFAPDSDIDTIHNAWNILSGPHIPFILKDYSSTFFYQFRLVRFDPEVHGNGQGITRVRTHSDYNDIQFTIRDLRRIDYGFNL